MSNTINSNSTFFYNVLEDYKRTTSYNSSRIKQDLTKELSTKSDYRGREIYELLQNAEDEKSDSVEISLDSFNNTLSVSNGGKNCTPFTEEGFCSIMMAEMSPKLSSKQTYIGCKGLGFRSILNWSEKVSIHSSGVCCTFSKGIALKYWKEHIAPMLSPENVEQHEQFARERLGVDCPVSILAIPDVIDDIEGDREYTTRIEVVFKKECENSITEQINSLSGKVLLFLKNIQTIKININGNKTCIRKEICSDNSVRVFDDLNPSGVEYTLFKETGIYDPELNKAYEVCLAYDKQNKSKGNYLYSFFPTKVKIGLPCVIHATFDLNSSRNSLNETKVNDWIQHKIASCLLEFASFLCKESRELLWEYVEMINLSEADQADFPILSEEFQKQKDGLEIFPTISSGYCKLTETVHFSEEFAKFQKNEAVIFANHLIEGYSKYGITNDIGNRCFCESVNKFSYKLQSANNSADCIVTRTNLIYAVSTVLNCCKYLSLLTDSQGQLIEKDAKINVGENIDFLPGDMHVSYVHEDLVNALINKFKIDESNTKRGLTKRLKKCQIDVGDMDLNAVKKRILQYMKNEMTTDGFSQLMFALYYKSQTSEQYILESLYKDYDFKLIAKDKSKHYPSELVISSDSIYRDDQLLVFNINDWVEKFNAYKLLYSCNEDDTTGIDYASVEEFFYDIVHVSRNIPLQFISLDYHAHGYLETYSKTLWKSISDYRYYYSTIVEEKNYGSYNRFHIVPQSFIDNLSSRGKKLTEIIKYIMSDPLAMKAIRCTTLHFQQRTLKSEDVEISYPLYLLRSYKQFKPLSMFVISENILLNGDRVLEQELIELTKEPECRQMLLYLGARPNISDLTLKELYSILKTLPGRELTRGVQKLYKSIREAINVKRTNQEFFELAENFKQEGTAYCRKDGGKLLVKPVSEIYYWDNEQLPHNILSTKYKLELPNRVGEDSVKDIFGVKLAKDIQIKIENSNESLDLEQDIAEHIKKRIRYFVAYRLENSREINDTKGKKTIADSLRNIQIKVYSSCRLSLDNTIIELNEGDMVSTRDAGGLRFHVRTSFQNIESAIKMPTFCENITEAICISLKVTSRDMANCFRSILKNTIEENDFISMKEVSRDVWEDVDKALGLTTKEKQFWETVASMTQRSLDISMLESSYSKKIEYLGNIFPNINIPSTYTEISELSEEEKYLLLLSLVSYGMESAEVLGENGLANYYQEWFGNRIMELKYSFTHNVYKYVTDEDNGIVFEDIPTWFYDKCMEFTLGVWLKDVIYNSRFKILNEGELITVFDNTFSVVFHQFGLLTIEDNWHPIELKQYMEILEENNLTTANIDQRELSYMSFAGYESIFRDLIKKYVAKVESEILTKNNFDVNEVEFSYGIGFNKNKLDNHTSNKKHGGRYSSDKEKHKAGLLAEQKVFNYLCSKNTMFTDVLGCSRNLDPINGNDNLHYDIIYSTINDGEKSHRRFLEVKSMTGDSIIMTNEEYKFATKNAEYYDFAIVNGNSITILRSPFLKNNQSGMLQVTPDTYVLTFDIKKIN